MTLREAARDAIPALEAAGIEDPAFEAELLARHAGRLDRAAYFAQDLSDSRTLTRFSCALERRGHREPSAYITGTREFYGLPFRVGRGVLIPRPETELLVEATLRELREVPAATVADIGTGSGCIAIAVKANASAATVIGVDRSPAALSRARRNARRLGADVEFIQGHLADPTRSPHIVVANLPYIPSATIADLEPEVRDWEPREALDGGPDGLTLVRELVADCAVRIRPRLLALEVGAGQAQTIADRCRALRASVEVTRDLAGIERMVTARWR